MCDEGSDHGGWLTSRARRRVHGTDAAPDVTRQREVVDAYLAASRGSDFQALLSLLDPDIVLRATGRGPRVRCSWTGSPGRCGRWEAPRVVFTFTIAGRRIVAIEMHADPGLLAGLEVTR
jgi:RNA polymerase sigma-70 factor (ECF subfamily)